MKGDSDSDSDSFTRQLGNMKIGSNDSDSDSDSDSFTRQLGNMKFGSNYSDSDSDSKKPKIPPRFRPAITKKRRLELYKQYKKQQKDPIHQITNNFSKMGVKETITKPQSRNNNDVVSKIFKDMANTNKKYKLNKPKK
jgi:hypothetical protein